MDNQRNPHDVLSRSRTYRILAVDDQEDILGILRSMLEMEGYEIVTAESGEKALAAFEKQVPDLVLADLQMPGMGGIELLERIRRYPEGGLLQVIVVTGSEDIAETLAALAAGADEIIRKPFKLDELQIRIRNALIHKALVDRLDRAENIIFTLAGMVEARDCETGDHCERLAGYCRRFAEILNLDPRDTEALHTGSFLHDIGKIAIPDAILLAPRALEPDEWDVMKTHPVRGASLCSGLKAAETALPIIRSHHERWDGSGYPDGLQGDAIPRAARIFQIVDIFDALTSPRPYKEALSTGEALAIMDREDAGGLYEPGLLDAWKESVERLPAHTAAG